MLTQLVQSSSRGSSSIHFGPGDKYLGVAVSPDGLLYCSDGRGQVTGVLNTVRRGLVGIRSFKVKNGGKLFGIALSRTGNVIVSAFDNSYISIYTAAGEFVRQFREIKVNCCLLYTSDAADE